MSQLPKTAHKCSFGERVVGLAPSAWNMKYNQNLALLLPYKQQIYWKHYHTTYLSISLFHIPINHDISQNFCSMLA
jgi:hypothetical protein